MKRIIREPLCRERTGLSRSQRWRLEREGEFPRRIRLGTNAVGWLEHEIEEWIELRAQERGERA